MKPINAALLILSSLFFMASMTGQVSLNSSEPNWQEMMRDPNISFYEIQAKFNAYWANRPIERGKGFKAFKRWEHFMTPRVNQETGAWPAPDAVWRAMQDSPQMFQQNQEMPGNWSYIGNTNVPSGGGGAGRVNGVRALPGSTTTWFICAPGGGLWKTTNSGASWSVVGTDFLSSIGCSDLAIDPTNTNIMYLATGDGDAGDTYALGVLKTTDGGLTWNTTGLNWNVTQTRTTNRILINPNNAQMVIAATSNGIWRTTDGGTNWTQEIGGDFKDLIYKPGDPTTVYACTDQFYVSTNSGDTWTNITSGLPTATNAQRMALAVSDANSAYVYILASGNDSGFLGVYRSTNSGTNFTTMATTPNLMGWDPNGGDAGGQGWYDLRIVADPANADIIYTGGVNVWKSTNGGTTWALNGHWYGGGGVPYVHADIHALYYVPGSSPSRLICGNDGGVFSTTNGGTNWTDLSNNLAIGQQYKLGLAALNSNLVLTGWQDNGTNLKNGATHTRPLGGDGMECAIDAANSNIMYGEIYYGSISKSTNGGASWGNIVASGGANEDEDGAWVTPFILGNTSGHIYVGKSRVYKSVDGGVTFTASGAFGSGNCNDLAIAPSNNNVIFASKGNSLFKSTDNGATFVAVSGLPSHFITDIAIHKTDANKVWVTYSNYTSGQKIYYSANGGTSWTNISGTLPNLPANAVVYQPGTNNGIYVGMDAGVYYRDDALGVWVPHNSALPNVEIYELEIHESTNTITAATYGRGLWRAPVYALPNLDAVLLNVNSPTGSSCSLDVNPSVEILNSGTTTITSMTIQYQVVGQALQTYNWTGSLLSTASTTIALPSVNYGAGSFTINFTITAVNGGVDDSPTNNTGTSNYVTINGTNSATLTLTTDCYASETSWELTNSSNQILFSGSGYSNSTTYNIPFCLPTECFTFTIYDSFGDGLFAGGNCANGDYQITDNLTSNIIVDNVITNSNFGPNEAHPFCYPLSTVPGCMDNTACNYNALATVSNGSCIYPPANDLCAGATLISTFGVPVSVNNAITCQEGTNPSCGGTTQMKDLWYRFVYNGGTVRIETAGGTLTDTRLAVYTSCGGTLIACDDDDSAGNYSLINFGCTTGTGAAGANEATLLVIGQTYYIQTGGYNALSGTFNLTVTITNVNGCTNPAACNYNPCANVNTGCVLPVTYYQDNDGDTYGNTAVTLTQCTVPAGYVTVSGDCNDNNNAINPGATENLCNGVDDNCNTTIDEGRINGCTNASACNYNPAATCDNGTCTLAQTWYLNADGDNYYVSTQSSCTSPGAGWTSTLPSGGAGDCNDSNPAINPGATENLCNGVDDNCNTTIDEGRVNGCTNASACNYNPSATCDNGTCVLPTTWYLNADGDNYYASTQVNCNNPGTGWTSTQPSGGAGDCNDSNPAINPGATESLCNGVDDNCNTTIDEGRINGCTNSLACNYNPAATCDDGSCGASQTWYLNADGDNYYASTQTSCTSPGAGWTTTLPSGGAGDCNDSNPAINPGATESLCNGVDDNCNTTIDEGRVNGCTNASACNYNPSANCDNGTCVLPTTWYLNADGDNFYASTQVNCTNPGAGWTSTQPTGGSGDCNDNSATVYPGATEICSNGIDDDCDTQIDENCGGGTAANDNVSSATNIQAQFTSYPACNFFGGDCTFASNSTESSAFTGSDVWYQFTALTEGVRFVLTSSSMDGALQLLDNTMTPVVNGAENVVGTGGQEILNIGDLIVGQIYYLSVGSSTSAGSNFGICCQYLLPSTCNTNTSLPLDMCTVFKPRYAGATTYTYTFVPTVPGTGGGSVTSTGAIQLSNTNLALQPGATYTVQINANYPNLANGLGQLEPITVETQVPCTVTILSPNWMQVRANQWCSVPVTLAPYTALRADPFVCGATSYTYQFTPASNCIGTASGSSFQINHPSRILYLNFNGSTTVPSGQTIQPNTFYNVSIRPNFGPGGTVTGQFGTSRTIYVGSTLSTEQALLEEDEDMLLSPMAEISIYPNPATGEEIQIQSNHFRDEVVVLSIYDHTGREIYRDQFEAVSEIKYSLALDNTFASGMYFVKMASNQKQVVETFIIQK